MHYSEKREPTLEGIQRLFEALLCGRQMDGGETRRAAQLEGAESICRWGCLVDLSR